MSQGFQNAVFELGGLPEEHRTDNLTAATHKLGSEERRAFNDRYKGLMEHYKLRASKNNPGLGHENGDVEKSHHILKRRLEQALLLRGSRDFQDRREYESFLKSMTERNNRGRQERFEAERLKLRPLPSGKLGCWKELQVRVGPGSTIRVDKNTYSVHSRLIGQRLRVRIHPDHIEVFVADKAVERLDRQRGKGKAQINYRHVVHSLVRKPGAFEGYVYKAALFPSSVFRKAFDALAWRVPEGAPLGGDNK